MTTLLHRCRAILWRFAAILCLAAGAHAAPVRIALDPPGGRDFVQDHAGLLNAADKEKLRKQCDALLSEKATPIIVVTISAMSEYGGEGMRIETFATLLFNQWQIGHEKIGGKDWNTGILLLVSEGDRKARIELGAGWGRREDELCRKIMNEHIIPHFRNGDYSAGIVAGVDALDKMARKLELPAAPRPWWHAAVAIGAIGLGIFTVVSLIRRGASGWAWLFWAGIFGLVGTILYQMLTSRGGSGGGFSGGSFGGGFSGGGGATGSW